MIESSGNETAVASEDRLEPASLSDSSLSALEQNVDDQVTVQQLGQVALFWRRFRRHKVALGGGLVLLFIIVIAIIGPYIAPESPTQYNFTCAYTSGCPPAWSFRYLFGSDGSGHSTMSQVLYGAGPSLEVGFFSALAATFIGIVVGAIAGYFGGLVDSLFMRVTDVFLCLPFLPMIIVGNSVLPTHGVQFIVLVFAFLGWAGVARLIRSYYLTFREQEFVEAARAVGAAPQRIIFRHILPNSLSPIIVSFTLAVAGFIATEAAVDFLGFGLQAPTISWGLVIAGGEQWFTLGNWWGVMFPAGALCLTVLAINFLGDGLRDALDVKSKATE